ncbi:MAG TPA: hypothetical protein VL137_11320, partial [Polyangiaceae bacterium]|nr:hypothetical protein [Polyangiaceae bacterium]
MKKKSSLYVLAGIGLVVACATSQTAEDLCDPRLRSCSLYAGIQHTGGGSMMDASTGGQIATGGESGAAGTTGGTATGGGGTPTGGGGHGG